MRSMIWSAVLVQVKGRVQQPALHHRGLVRGEVIADYVDRQARRSLAVDLAREVAEVHGPVLGGQPARRTWSWVPLGCGASLWP